MEPLHRAVQRSGVIIAIPILAGLHHQYVWIWATRVHSVYLADLSSSLRTTRRLYDGTTLLGSRWLKSISARIGLHGCRNLRPGDDSEFIATIYRAIELGVTFLDTADMYGSGHNED